VGFKIKCYNEIYKIMKRAAVIFVSHSMPQVAKVCTRGILMSSGLVKCASDNVATVIDEYYNEFSFGSAHLSGNHKAVIRAISITHPEKDDYIAITQDQPVINLAYGQPVNIKLLVDVDPSVARFNIIYSFTDIDQKLIAQCFSNTSIPGFVNNGQGTVQIGTQISPFSLGKGKYTLSVTIREVNENGNFTAVLTNYMQMIEIRVTHHSILGAAPIQFDAPWTIDYV
jgi:lipopolysaccharide transport system ATP-binding protein